MNVINHQDEYYKYIVIKFRLKNSSFPADIPEHLRRYREVSQSERYRHLGTFLKGQGRKLILNTNS